MRIGDMIFACHPRMCFCLSNYKYKTGIDSQLRHKKQNNFEVIEPVFRLNYR